MNKIYVALIGCALLASCSAKNEEVTSERVEIENAEEAADSLTNARKDVVTREETTVEQ